MAQQFGLGNFLYDLEVKDGTAYFHFVDPEDSNNTADVSIAQNEFPEGVTQATARQVADLAYLRAQKVLNDRRDTRFRKEAKESLAAEHEEKARARDAAADFLANSNDVATQPVKVEDDGTHVYNTANVEDQTDHSDNKKK